LIEESDQTGAIRALRQYRAAFPGQSQYFLEKEVDLLLELKRDKEAEALYFKSFDPLWSDEQNQRFYEDFLGRRERLRAYGRELKQGFRRNPANFDLAMRLYHYAQYDRDTSEAFEERVFIQLEKARSERGVKWSPKEL